MGKFEMESDEDVSIDEKAGIVYPSHYQEKKMISVNDIIFDTTQSRHGEWENDELDLQLMSSVEEIGLIYDIMVRPTDSVKYGGNHDKPYACVAGSRRFHSMIAAGHTEVPCIIRDLSDIDAVMYSLSENIGRKALTPFQEQRAVNLWFNMLLEKRTQEFMKDKGIDNIEGDNYKGDRRKIRTSVVQNIADKIYAKKTDSVHRILRIGSLPDSIKGLLKKLTERTPEDIKILKSYGLKHDFMMDKDGLLIIREIQKRFFGEEKIDSIFSQKIFEMIKKSKIDEKEFHATQNYILKDIRDQLKAGKSFEVVMKELKTKEKEYTFEEGVQRYIIRVPPDYTKWHERACSELRKKSNEIISYIYLKWLRDQAKKNDWKQ